MRTRTSALAGPRVVAQRALGGDGRLDGGPGAREGKEEGVALRVHLRSALLGEALADDAAMC